MLEAPPKDSDEIIEELTRRAMMNLPKHPDMLSPEEREQLDAKEKERFAEQERDRIILREIEESFDRIGLEYKSGNDKLPMEFAIGFSQTAREYYKAQQQAQAEQEASTQDGTATTPTCEECMQSEDSNHNEPDTHNAESINEVQDQDASTNQQSPFGHLSRKEYLKRIGITN
jgi:hypothetical protein